MALARILGEAGMIAERAEAVAAAMDLGRVTSAVHDLGDGLRVHRLGLLFPLPTALIAEELRRHRRRAQPIADLAEVAGRVGPVTRGGASPHAGHLPDDGPVRIQRAACYAVVREPGRVLLTRLRRTGLWALPGGGIDIGEHPEDALTREVFEESGFRLTDVRMAGVGTAQWTGRAPDGVLEDFQAVNLLYTGTAPPGSATAGGRAGRFHRGGGLGRGGRPGRARGSPRRPSPGSRWSGFGPGERAQRPRRCRTG